MQALARSFLNSLSHSWGGRSEFARRICPLPSLFMTIFIFVALTKSGLIVKSKKMFGCYFGYFISYNLFFWVIPVWLLFVEVDFSFFLNLMDYMIIAATKNPPVPQLLSSIFSPTLGAIIDTAICITLRGVKNSPLSPRRFAPTISSYALPLRLYLYPVGCIFVFHLQHGL